MTTTKKKPSTRRVIKPVNFEAILCNLLSVPQGTPVSTLVELAENHVCAFNESQVRVALEIEVEHLSIAACTAQRCGMTDAAERFAAIAQGTRRTWKTITGKEWS